VSVSGIGVGLAFATNASKYVTLAHGWLCGLSYLCAFNVWAPSLYFSEMFQAPLRAVVSLDPAASRDINLSFKLNIVLG